MDYWSSYWKAAHASAVTDQQWGATLAECLVELTVDIPQGGKALDLATGNGQLVRYLSHRDQQWVATDLADISAIDGVVTLRQVPLQNQPFSDAQFSLVCSMFGLEYGPWPSSLNEAWRVLCHGGSLVLIVHHENSVITQQAKKDLIDVEYFLSSGVVDCVENLIMEMGKVDTDAKFAALDNNPNARKLKQHLDGLLSRLREQVSGGFFDFQLKGVMLVLNEMMGDEVKAKLSRWQTGVGELKCYGERLKHQIASAKDEQTLSSGINGLLTCEDEFTLREVRTKDNQMLAWVIKLRKS
ncbi:class I SAM-dependent methyltransferase [Ferrimonas sp.]|uniref:class I SAM-dependent methyltransferase n=1 Tax=Ferrimonas sp. TaxID=2080861 RepID=UPI003A8F4527